MIRFVCRRLIFDPLRTCLTVLALAAVIAVILILEGFNQGLIKQLGNVVLNRQADLIVTQSGVSNLTAARSVLPQNARRDVESVRGVVEAHPLTGVPLIYRQGNRRTPIFLLIYDTLGGPRRVVEGAAIRNSRDIVIDQSLAQQFGLTPGDTLLLSGFAFRVCGVTSGAAAFFTPFAFAKYDDLIDFYFESDLAADIGSLPLISFLLVQVEPGADLYWVGEEIERVVPSGDVFLPEDLAREDQSLGKTLFGPIFGLLITVGYAVGLFVTGIIMFASVNGRRGEFGVLKAVGFGPGFLSLAVLIEGLGLALMAIPVGIGLATLIGLGIEGLMPLYLIPTMEPEPLVRTVVACVGFSVVGALLPVLLIRRADPSLVLRT